MKKIFLLSLTLIFATELEVDGNLKVTGDIDASGNPVKNIGLPTSLNNAINGNALQDALRDDTQYEYNSMAIRWNNLSSSAFQSQYKVVGSVSWVNDWESYINSLTSNGWRIFTFVPSSANTGENVLIAACVIRRPIETNE